MLAIVVQARFGSTRLRGKVLRRLGDRTVLDWVIRAAQSADCADAVVVATTQEAADDEVACVAADAGAVVVRGSTDDVLSRFVMAVEHVGADSLVRLTADCPLLDPAVIRMACAAFSAGEVDYLSSITPRTLPRGLDVEVFSATALQLADRHATGHHRAHVTSWLYETDDRVRRAGLVFAPAAAEYRVTIDTAEDALLVEAIVAELGDRPPRWTEIVELLRRRPELVELNAHVEQKHVTEG